MCLVHYEGKWRGTNKFVLLFTRQHTHMLSKLFFPSFPFLMEICLLRPILHDIVCMFGVLPKFHVVSHSIEEKKNPVTTITQMQLSQVMCNGINILNLNFNRTHLILSLYMISTKAKNINHHICKGSFKI